MKNKEQDLNENQQEEQLVDEQSAGAENNSQSNNEEQEAENPVKKLEADVAEMKDKYLRLYSDFENFRKRNAKERLELIKTASEDVLRELLPVLDDFERALKASENEEDALKVREGNQLIFHKFSRILESKGLKPMEDLIGKPFDADTQEAITQIPAPTEEMKGKVIDVVEKGYTLGEKVVRFAKVVTGA
ncbi:nucleotide exchange factor GrpE [Algoriphagus sp. CAU 1675]|uniref:nucleotide exchange factor GrpE n=1 Tax=Algoriphagus sp. CAU 1675 TaxID=3032597 RepID=UPI0023DC5D8D|nr:nucleotide exchange factor GrpE [Algoriphagus sp. CAU 1675]MDF2158969.1 nucleotide exchange factor GrpE [Algoriphagus sp. CAU 1675]